MGVVEDVVSRLILEPTKFIPAVANGAQTADYAIHSGDGQTSSNASFNRPSAGAPMQNPMTEVVRNVVNSTLGKSSQPRPTSSRVEVYVLSEDAMRSQAESVMDRPKVDQVTPLSTKKRVRHSTGSALEIVEPKRDLDRYALGGGDLGRIGVTPVEMAAAPHQTGGIRNRLINAIDEFVTYHQAQHTANLIRQGITPR